jgi:plexin A
MFIYHSLFQVEVGMGKLRYVIGKLSYASPAGLNGPLSKPALIGIVAGIVVLFLIFVAFLIAYRRKSTESNRVLKNMQEQMDILELRVAAECKEGEKELVLFINITSIMLLPALWNTDKLAVVILI